MKTNFNTYLLLIAFFFTGSKAFTQDTLWISEENSPYYIMQDLVIEDGGAFIISEGAKVFIANDVSILCHAPVSIKGTADKPIEIKPINPGIGWQNIEITASADIVNIEHAIIEDGLLLITDCAVNFNHVDFINNQSSQWNSAISRFFGGSLVVNQCSITADNNGEGFLCHDMEAPIFTNNIFTSIPDAIEMLNCENGIIRNCEFRQLNDDAIDLNNCRNILIDSNFIHQVQDRGMEIGSEDFGSSTNIILSRNVISECKEGITFKEGSTGLVENNTFYNNSVGVAAIEPKKQSLEGSHAIIRNCIFSQNTLAVFTDEYSSSSISYSLSDGVALEGEYNITGDPGFRDAELLDFSLLETSICINAGDPASTHDPDGSRADIGAFHLSILGSTEVELAKLKSWPNPVKDRISIALPPNITCESFYLIGLSSKNKIHPIFKSDNKYEFDLSQFSSGIYFILCQNSKANYTFKVVKL